MTIGQVILMFFGVVGGLLIFVSILEVLRKRRGTFVDFAYVLVGLMAVSGSIFLLATGVR